MTAIGRAPMGSLHPTLSALSHRTGRINPVHETQPDPPVTFADRAATNKPLEGSAYARIDARRAFALPRIIEHAAKYHGTQEVVTRSVEGPIHRTNYAEIHARALKVSQRLAGPWRLNQGC